MEIGEFLQNAKMYILWRLYSLTKERKKKLMIIVNGWSISNNISGTSRYAIEILNRIDSMIEYGELELYVQENVSKSFNYKNIKVCIFGNKNKYLALIELRLIVAKKKAIYIDFSNGLALGRNAIVTRHDMYVFYNDIIGLSRIKITQSKIKAYQSFRKAKKIVTVSESSKKEIIKWGKVNADKIIVIPNAWQHIISIREDDRVLKKNNISKNYCLFVGRLVKNKNFKWIFNVADRNQNEVFVIAGEKKNYEKFEPYYGINNNIIYTGYVTDEEIVALYKNCKAFIFPSLMEGFGIPPMEALYFGKPIIISDIPTLREIYRDSAHYINPFLYDYDINSILKEPVTDYKTVLGRYSWDKVAKQWFKLICSLKNMSQEELR